MHCDVVETLHDKFQLIRYRQGGVAQWVACLTRDQWMPVSREIEPNQRPLLFPYA